MTILLAVLGAIVLASIVEGLLHQFILHTPQRKLMGGLLYKAFHAHAVEHHPAYRDESYHRPAPDYEKKVSLEWYTLPLLLIFTSPFTWLAWKFMGTAAGIAVPLTLTVYYIGYETLHWHMHFPNKDGGPRWWYRIKPVKAYFDWFDKRHFIHHLADDRNFNVVLPVYDLMTGRYTMDEKSIPWAIRVRTKRNLKKSEKIREKLAAERK